MQDTRYLRFQLSCSFLFLLANEGQNVTRHWLLLSLAKVTIVRTMRARTARVMD